MVPSAAEFVDHTFQAIAALGIVYTGIRAHLAARNSKQAKQVAEETRYQVRSSHGSKTTAKVVEDANSTVEQIREEIQHLIGKIDDLQSQCAADTEELLAEQASLAAMFGAHLIDGHDPIGQMSRRKNRRLDDPKEY